VTDNINAFISKGAFEIDGLPVDGAVIADCDDEGRVMIVFRPLGGIAGVSDLAVLIDNQDLASVNALLRQQAEVEAAGGEEPAPDGSRVLVASAPDLHYEIAKLRALVLRARRLLKTVPALHPAKWNETWEASVARWMADEGGSREANS